MNSCLYLGLCMVCGIKESPSKICNKAVSGWHYAVSTAKLKVPYSNLWKRALGHVYENTAVTYVNMCWKEYSLYSLIFPYYRFNCFEQSPSPEYCQGLSRILWNPKFHCCVHYSPPVFPSWAIWTHFTPSHPIFLRSISIYAYVVQGFRFPHHPRNALISIVCHMPHPFHPLWVSQSNYILWGLPIKNLLTVQFC